MVIARGARARFGSTWSMGELGAAGPTGSRYGEPAGTSVIAVAGPVERSLTVRTGSDDRHANMRAFALAMLDLLAQAIAAARARRAPPPRRRASSLTAPALRATCRPPPARVKELFSRPLPRARRKLWKGSCLFARCHPTRSILLLIVLAAKTQPTLSPGQARESQKLFYKTNPFLHNAKSTAPMNDEIEFDHVAMPVGDIERDRLRLTRSARDWRKRLPFALGGVLIATLGECSAAAAAVFDFRFRSMAPTGGRP